MNFSQILADTMVVRSQDSHQGLLKIKISCCLAKVKVVAGPFVSPELSPKM